MESLVLQRGHLVGLVMVMTLTLEIRVANAKSIDYTLIISIEPIVEPILNVVAY